MSATTAIQSVATPPSARTTQASLMAMARATLTRIVASVARPRRMANGTARRSSAISATSAVSMAASVPAAPIAMPTSAAASAGASLMPSPTIATAPYSLAQLLDERDLVGGHQRRPHRIDLAGLAGRARRAGVIAGEERDVRDARLRAARPPLRRRASRSRSPQPDEPEHAPVARDEHHGHAARRQRADAGVEVLAHQAAIDEQPRRPEKQPRAVHRRPRAPVPGCARTVVTGGASTPAAARAPQSRDRSDASTARRRAAAAASTAAMSAPSTGCTSSTVSAPCVSVPVLSSATARIAASRSR